MVEVQWTKGWGKMSDSELSDSRMFPHTYTKCLIIVQYNSLYLAPVGPDRFQIIMQHIYWTNFLKSNILILLLSLAAQLNRGIFHLYISCRCWCFKFCSQPSKNVHLSVTFISLQNDWTFLIIIGSIMGFPSDSVTLNRSYTLFFCANLGSFMSFTWNGSSHFHLMP